MMDTYERVASKDIPDSKKPISLKQLFRFATPLDGSLILLGSLTSLIHGGGWPILFIIFGDMTNSFLDVKKETNSSLNFTMDNFQDSMNQSALYYIYIGLAILVTSYFQTACWATTAARQINRLHKKFFYCILHQEIGWFDVHQSGDLTNRLTDDLVQISQGIGDKIGLLLQTIAGFIFGFAIGFWKGWKLTLVMISLAPLMALCAGLIGKIVTQAVTQEQDIYATAGSIAHETLSCIRTVTAFNGQKKELKRYDEKLEAGKKQGIRKHVIMGALFGVTFLILFGTYALGFWYGTTLVLSGEMSAGDVFTVFLCVIIASFSVGGISPYISAIATAKGAAVTVHEIINNAPAIDSYSTDGLRPNVIEGNIAFQGVSFSYPTRPDVPVLTNFHMTVKAGQTVALVGASGSGKSTIVNLLLRFYDPLHGKIVVDNLNLTSVNLNWLRNLTGVVSQEPILFGCSIRENIIYGWESAQENDMIYSAKMANAHNFITQLPQGYETLVGERGIQLSGGQKQRIAIARALIRNPRILFLDEATSALDSESEKLVQEALDNACAGRTTLIVAHRLSTVQNVDTIYVLDKGQLVESGSPTELMKIKGLYYQMAILQTLQEKKQTEPENEEMVIEPGSPSKFSRSSSLATSHQSPHHITLSDKGNEKEDETDEEIESPGFFRMLRTNSPEWHLILIGVISSLGAGAIFPVLAIFYGEIFNTFSELPEKMKSDSLKWSLMFLGLGVASCITHIGMTGSLAASGELLTKRLRLQSFQNILRQDIAWFDNEKHQTGKLTTRLGTDAPLVKGATGSRIGNLFSSVVSLFVGLFIAFYYGWKLALVILASAPLIVLSGRIEMKIHGGMEKKKFKHMKDAGQIASEAIENIRTVQALTREKRFFQTYCQNLVIPYNQRLKEAQLYGLTSAFSQSLLFFLYAGCFVYGGYLVIHENMPPENVFKVFFAIAFSATSIGGSMAYLPDYAKAKIAASYIFHLMAQKPTIDSSSPLGAKPDITGEITVKNIYFTYPSRPDITVLKGISFRIRAGQTLALVGTSGCGKSTITSLLERFYDPDAGKICIDGHDIRTMNISWLRSHISLVSQEPILFDCSIRDNIAYGMDDFVPDEKIFDAARTANIHDFIVSLPQGYDTIAGEKGTQLSGGQKQRVAIARALLRDPKILLLDEATSALDSESEKVVQETLNHTRTCLVIAHRLSTIQNADVIAVIDGGVIVEHGTHQELLSKQGHYYKLTRAQLITS